MNFGKINQNKEKHEKIPFIKLENEESAEL